MRDLVEEAAELQALLETKGWEFCFIGGLAIQRWSEPRLTKDMDLTLLTGFGEEEPFVDLADLKDSPEILDHLKALRTEVKAGER